MPPPAGHSHLIGDNLAKLRLSSDFGWDSLLKNAPGHHTTRREVEICGTGSAADSIECHFRGVSAFSSRGGHVVCSNCGQQNPVMNLFCGVCGTPLPQRPLTTPGAQSTLRFTRVPVETQAATAHRSTAPQAGDENGADSRGEPTWRDQPSSVTSKSGVLLEVPAATTTASPTDVRETNTPLEPVAQDLVEGPESRGETTDAPYPTLKQVLKDYRYDPTKSAVTPIVRKRDPFAEADRSSSAGRAAAPFEHAHSPSSLTDPLLAPTQQPGFTTGLVEPGEESMERSRFLDLGHLATDKARRGTSTIVGPSFLGLSDASALDPGFAADEPRGSSSHWGLWIALIMIAVFGGLGYLEWRSQVTQSSNGPWEVMKMQVSRLKHLRTDASAAKTSSDANASQPDIQVEPQVQPQDANPATTAANTANADATGTSAGSSADSVSPAPSDTMPAATPSQNANAAIGNQPPAGGDTTSAEQSASPADNATAVAPVQPDTAATRPAPAKTPGNASVQSRRSKTPATDDQEVITRKLEPGQDELARANYASDSDAAAAWLWRATAKGNPDAPVRLADMYIKGDGVPRSCDQALVLLKSAASKPNVRARNRLAALYATGICVQRDRIQAFRWLNSALAADPNSDWALQNRDLVWRQMTPDERTLAAKYR